MSRARPRRSSSGATGAAGAIVAVQSPSPWPGPVPYSEAEARYFFGRERETELLLNQVRFGRLSVLTAWSGAGKSSLIHAGLVPTLRSIRCSPGGRGFGFVLVLGSWGSLVDKDAEVMIATAIWEEIRRLRRIRPTNSASDLEQLEDLEPPHEDRSGGSRPVDLVHFVREICDRIGSLVLVVDQAEELLGSGLDKPDPELERSVLGAIARLHREVSEVTILIALREEYYARLRVLDQFGLAIDSRTYRLPAMRREAVLAATMNAAQKSPVVRLNDDAAQELIRWSSRRPRGAKHFHDEVSASSEVEFSLLGLQALLVGVFDWAQVRRAVDEPVVISAELLKSFEVDLRKTVVAESDGSLATLALRRFIERLFDDSQRDPVISVRRRLLARMARFLSGPGGFKRHLEESELVYQAIADDLQRIGVRGSPEEHRDVLRSARARGARSEQVEFDFVQDADGMDGLSGVMRSRKLAADVAGEGPEKSEAMNIVRETATTLVNAGFGLLQYLKERNVLRSGFANERHTCELAHDGMGEALLEWAEQERPSFRDAYASIVSLGGEDFQWATLGGTESSQLVIRDVCWLTCRLAGATLQNVRFRRCDLKGMLFSRCHFSNVVFEGCDLTGAVFRDCSVGDSGDLSFKSTKASSTVFLKTRLSGMLRFTECDLTFAQLISFLPEDTTELRLLLDQCDLRNALFCDMDAPRWVKFRPSQDSKRRRGLISSLEPILDTASRERPPRLLSKEISE